MMANMTENPENINFDVRVTGTTNMTSSLKAYTFAAKGHYYDLTPVAAESAPKLYNKDMEEILPVADDDDTFLGVERFSGVCVVALERIFFNMAIYGDDLFQNFTPELSGDIGFFFPQAFVKREAVFTQD